MKEKIKIFLIYGLAICLSLLVLTPLFWMLLTSFKGSKEIISYPPSIFPETFTLENYFRLFNDTGFLRYLKNSFGVAISVMVVTNFAAVLGAYSLTRFRYFGRGVIVVSSLMGYMIAPIMIVIPFYLMMRVMGVGNTHLALILAHTAFCFPFALWLMKSYFQDLPQELEKAARIDGASRLQTLIHVVLPNAMPGVAAVSIFIFILSWNDYVFARILITSDYLKTIPVGIEDIYNATVVDWGLLMAAGVIITVPILMGFIFVNKFLMKGLGYSGLKN
ncbi:MAG: carbohydrate ABC transporter permease [Candidatus Aminicenantes bacterium]|nr:MAG: carbohydrate ABC transporter permease [Candidatus Aminicenantes bacterium]